MEDIVSGDNQQGKADQGSIWDKLLRIPPGMVDLDNKEDTALLGILKDIHFQDNKVDTVFVDIHVGTEY